MADNNSIFDDEVEDKMRRVLVKRLANKGNRITTSIADPSLFAHRDNTRCICDACSDARVPPPPKPYSKRLPRARMPQPEACGNPPRPRYPNTENAPTRAIDFEGHLPFALRLMDGAIGESK